MNHRPLFSLLALAFLMPWVAQAENASSELEDEIEFIGPMLPSAIPRDAALELPEWKVDDIRELDINQAPTNLGGGLWPGDLWPLMPTPKPLPPIPKPHPSADSQAASTTKVPLPEELMGFYFSELPQKHIVDPQGFLMEEQKRDIGKFFDDFVTVTAGVAVRVLVIRSDQRIPDSVALDEITNQWFNEQQGMIVIYPMGQPKSSLCYFSKPLQQAIGTERLAELREASIKEAMLVTRADEQISRYCIKLAVRLHHVKQAAKASPALAVNEGGAKPKESTWAGSWKIVSRLAIVAILGGLSWMAYRFRDRFVRKSTAKQWLFPDQDMITRLGAPHCGGTMAVVKFK